MAQIYGSSMVYLDLIIVGLAIYYTVTVLIEEKGMFGVFSKLRILLGMNREVLINTADVHDDEQWEYIIDNEFTVKEFEDERYVPTERFWSQVFECHRCLSPYVALIFLVIYIMGGINLLAVLGLAGFVVALKER